MAKLAAVKVRGVINAITPIKDTIKMLKLHRTNYCVILENNPSNTGMLKMAKDYITWGEINEETLKLLKQKKGEQKFYKLTPPRKGYGRKGIKTSFTDSGALGYRGEKINDLLQRML